MQKKLKLLTALVACCTSLAYAHPMSSNVILPVENNGTLAPNSSTRVFYSPKQSRWRDDMNYKITCVLNNPTPTEERIIFSFNEMYNDNKMHNDVIVNGESVPYGENVVLTRGNNYVVFPDIFTRQGDDATQYLVLQNLDFDKTVQVVDGSCTAELVA